MEPSVDLIGVKKSLDEYNAIINSQIQDNYPITFERFQNYQILKKLKSIEAQLLEFKELITGRPEEGEAEK